MALNTQLKARHFQIIRPDYSLIREGCPGLVREDLVKLSDLLGGVEFVNQYWRNRMAVDESYKDYVVDQLGKLGFVTVKEDVWRCWYLP